MPIETPVDYVEAIRWIWRGQAELGCTRSSNGVSFDRCVVDIFLLFAGALMLYLMLYLLRVLLTFVLQCFNLSLFTPF